MPSSDPSRDYDLLDRLVEEFNDRFRRGERPSVQEYCDRYPQLADDLRELLPAAARVEHAKDVLAADPPPPPPAAALLQMGDFRILREIGHGGMGVVYEAEQVSLGRRVALKLLTQRLLRDVNQRRRFEREARSAARLHHTNIVPVFGFGEHGGTPYYVMQFIQGTGLDVVVEEVARLEAGGPVRSPGSPSSRTGPAVAAARSLVTGVFQAVEEGEPGANPFAGTGTFAFPELAALDSDPTADQPPGPPAPRPPGALTDTSGVTSSVTLPGQSGIGSGRKARKLTYWQGVARIGAQAAAALEYAHLQGIVHRDVKPSNLLLDLAGTLWVTDFGLAKADGGENLTHTGDILGTLRYMPPEAFDGRADARSDVYSLGLTLYEMLALRPAFDETDRNRLIKQVTTGEVTPLRKTRRGVPRDLETIVHKATDRDPARRYQTAAELRDDLQRFVDDEPITARRQTAAEAAWRWARHHKAMAALVATVGLVLVAVTIGSVALAAYFRDQEAAQRGLVNDKTELAERNRKLADVADKSRQTAETALRQAETTLVDMQTARGLLAAERGDSALAVLWFAKAADQAASDPRRQAESRLRARNWARDVVAPVGVCSIGADPLQMEFRTGNDLLLVRTETRLAVWDWRRDTFLPWTSGLGQVSAAAWSPDGTALAVGTKAGEVQIRSVPDGTVLRSVSRDPSSVGALAYSPDGRYLALAVGATVTVWDTGADEFLAANWQHPQAVQAIAFNSRGDQLVTACGDRQARVFAVGPPDRLAPLFDPVPHTPETISAPAFVDDDRGLVTVTGTSRVSWWDAETGQPAGFESASTTSTKLQGVAAGPGGKWFAAWGHDSAHVWNTADGGAKPLELKHRNHVRGVAFGRDGVTILTVDFDRNARLWALPDGREIGAPLPHFGVMARCALSADGLVIATGDWNGHLRVWKRPGTPPPALHRTDCWRSRVGPDGLLLAPGRWHESPQTVTTIGVESLKVVDVVTGKPAGPAVPVAGFLLDSCICADGRTAAAVSIAGATGRLLVCDVPTGRVLPSSRPLPFRPASVAARPKHPHVAVLCEGGALLVFDVRNGDKVFETRLDGWGNTVGVWPRVEYTPDGVNLVVVTAGWVNEVHVRNPDTGALRYPPIRPVIEGGPCRAIALSADSRLLATAVNGKNSARVWELATGRPLCDPLPHPGDFFGLFCLAFSPDGRHLLTGAKDGQARLWDWKAGALACPPMQHADELHAVAFTPDGRYALAGGRYAAAAVHVWEVMTGKLVAPPVRLLPNVSGLAPAPDGSHVIVAIAHDATTGFGARIDLADVLSPPASPTEDFTLLGELATGRRIELGDVGVLTPEQWEERWNRYRPRVVDHTRPTLTEALVRAADHSAAARKLVGEGHPREAYARWRRAVLEIDRAAADEVERQKLRVEVMNEARGVLEAHLGDRFDDVAALPLADLLLESHAPVESTVLTPTEMTSAGGALLGRLPDGSVLAGGPTPDRDSYTVTVRNPLTGATALRLEALPDPSLPRNGPGRAGNGNFCLTEVSLAALRPGREPPRPIPLVRAAGTYRRPAGSGTTTLRDGPHGVIDGTHTTWWDLWPHEGQPHGLFFEPAAPLADGEWTVRIDCRNPLYAQHVIGRFRLSVTTRPHVLREHNLLALAAQKGSRTRLAVAYIVRGEWARARDVLQNPGRAVAESERLPLLGLVQEQLGQTAAADKTLDEALGTVPRFLSDQALLAVWVDVISARIARDPKPSLLLARANWCGALGRAAEARADLDRAVELDPKLPLQQEHAYTVLRLVAEAAADKGEWEKAAGYYSRGLELLPRHPVFVHAHLLLCLQRGDTAGYQKSCAELVKRFGEARPGIDPNSVAWACVLGPDSGVATPAVLKIAELAVKNSPGGLTRNTLAAALYRAGKYEQAVETLARPAAPTPASAWVYDWLLLAMAHHRLGHKEEAREWLAKAAEFVAGVKEGVVAEAAIQGVRWDWQARLEIELLFREAGALIEGKEP